MKRDKQFLYKGKNKYLCMSTEDKNKKKPLKKRASKKSISTKLSAADVEQKIPVEKNLHVEDVIKQAFLRFYDNASIRGSKVKDLEHLDTITQEYLNSYMILGYDINGEKVSIMHAENSHDRDALVEHLRTTLLNFLNPNER
jgi:hypothetical protein